MGTKRGTTSGQHSFAKIPTANIQRSVFDRSCGLKTTFNAGVLIPIFVDEALPGDTMSLRMSTFARLATPLHPILDNLYLDWHFFAVPNRLLWDNWQKFNGEQASPGDSTDFLVPQINLGTPAELSLSDYFGIPTKVGGTIVNALHFRAYNLIWNEWYRDENLVDPAVVDTGDAGGDTADYFLRPRGKRHDYFTSCLPFPQKGPSVQLPLGTSAPVISEGVGQFATFKFFGGETGVNLQSTSSPSQNVEWSTNPDNQEAAEWDDPALIADLSTATAATINEIREAFQIQRMFEKDARGGTRYTELLKAHFGVTSPDSRLQRPEYLGGGSQAVGVTPVPQTGQTDTTPQGNLAAYGTSSSSGHGFHKSFTEHCVIIGLASIRADLNYSQGIDRMWSRQTRFDFFWPSLAHLGEQTVLNQEIYWQNQVVFDKAAFGYQERYAEYRYKPSKITGLMRSNATTSLDTWHLALDFGALPVLGETFITDKPPIERIIAVPTEPHFLLDAFFQFKCARPMPMYGVPGNIDRF